MTLIGFDELLISICVNGGLFPTALFDGGTPFGGWRFPMSVGAPFGDHVGSGPAKICNVLGDLCNVAIGVYAKYVDVGRPLFHIFHFGEI